VFLDRIESTQDLYTEQEYQKLIDKGRQQATGTQSKI
jgi:hypothetical protein